jgi:hypothetical protein
MDEEMKKHTPVAPFAYDNDYYLYKDKDEAEKSKFVSFMTQRDAQYKTPAQEVYVGTGLVSEGTELVRESFFLNIDPPVPQIKQIDGYSPEEEESGSSDGGGESGGDTTPDDDGCEDPGNGCDEPVEP